MAIAHTRMSSTEEFAAGEAELSRLKACDGGVTLPGPAAPAAAKTSVGEGLGAGVPRWPRDCWRDLVAVEIEKTCGDTGSASRSAAASERG